MDKWNEMRFYRQIVIGKDGFNLLGIYASERDFDISVLTVVVFNSCSWPVYVTRMSSHSFFYKEGFEDSFRQSYSTSLQTNQNLLNHE